MKSGIDGGAVDIRLAQKLARNNMFVPAFGTVDVPLGFCLLNGGIAEAFNAWRSGRQDVAEELAGAALLMLTLAEMVGADMQEAISVRLACGPEHARPLPGETLMDGTAAPTVPLASADGVSGLPTDGRIPPRHGKLVRDKIPQIIRAKGEEPEVRTADGSEYRHLLRAKLSEEVAEFLASSDDPEELADILEVLFALAEQTGIDRHRLEKLRAVKQRERGGFADRIIWFGNRPASSLEG